MTWTLAHAAGMLLVVGAALALGDPRPVAAFGAASLVVFVALRAPEWKRSGGFGAANTVTASRVGLVVLLAALPAVGPLASLLVMLVLFLDGVDGVVARRSGRASSFGAEFDMETDALLVLVAGVKLALVGRPGAFIVLPGLYRYLYAVAISLYPSTRGDAPRTLAGRYAFAVMVVSLAASLWPVEPLQGPLSVAAVALLTVSFARSTWWSFLARGERAEPLT